MNGKSLIPETYKEVAIKIYDDAATLGMKEVGTAIEGLLKLVTLPFKMAGMTADQLANKYKLFIENSVKKVPEEKRVMPSPKIVAQLFENLKYVFDEEEIVKLFSELLSSSINLDKAGYVHPAFINIITQMSPLDAELFTIISSRNDNPVIQLINPFENPEGKYSQLVQQPRLTNIHISGIDDRQGSEALGLSLDNLERLKLISVSYDQTYEDNGLYDSIEGFSYFDYCLEKWKSDIGTYDVKRGIIEMTTLGKSFYDICIPAAES